MRLTFYYASFVFGLAAAVLCSIRIGKRKGLSRRDSAVFTATGFTAGVLGAVLMACIYNAVLTVIAGDEPFSRSNFSLYGGLLFVPPLIILPAKLGKISLSNVLDTCAAGVYLLIGTAKIGCAVYGCWYGIECRHGIVNPQTGLTVFPVQLLETVLCYIIAALLYKLALSEKTPSGAVYPAGLIVYGTARFFAQFLRAHEIAAEADLIGFMDLWQTVSVIAVLYGAVWLLLRRRIVHTSNTP